MEKKVSIIVSVYKAEEFIKRCVDSLLRQTYQNIEIILIEDGSPDRSGEIIDNYTDPRIKVVHNPNLGVSHTRNVGLALASGDYVTFCDSDDYYSLDHVEKVLHAAIDQDADIVISGYYLESEGSFTSSVKMRSHVINQDEVVKHCCIDNEFGGFCWNKLYKKEVIAGNHFPEDLDILEDTYFLCLGVQRAQKMYYLAEPLYYYCDNQDSAVRNITNLFSDHDSLKYADSYDKIMCDFDFSKPALDIIHSTMFNMAVNFRHMMYLGMYSGNQALLDSFNRNIKKYRSDYYSSKEYSLESKIKTTVKWLLPKLHK